MSGDFTLSSDLNDNCDSNLGASSLTSDFEADYQLIQNQSAQYCMSDPALQDGLDTTSWQGFIDLVKSGYNHLESNYELLLAGEIGAIYIVALIPLLLGLILEISLMISHRRKEGRSDNRQRQAALMTQGRVVADKIAGVTEPYPWVYRVLTGVVISLHLVLVLLFIVAVPEYDRDVWCEEHKTQNSILKAGMETERLQRYQRRANCEIRKAVVLIDESVETLSGVFSKENQSTVSTLKEVVAKMSDSARKLDSTKTAIDGFQVQLEQATANTEDVLKTLLVMEEIAIQVGATDKSSNGALITSRTIPAALSDIEGLLSLQPTQDWYQSHLVVKADLEKLATGSMLSSMSLTEVKQEKSLQKLAEQQALMQKNIAQLQSQRVSQELVTSLADKVAEKVKQQTRYPLIMQPMNSAP
jgi:hypothetical protein